MAASARATPTIGRPGAARPAVADGLGVLASLPDPLLVLDAADAIRYVNSAGEAFFEASAAHLSGCPLREFLPGDSPIFALVATARQSGNSVSDYSVEIETPRLGQHVMTVQASPLAEQPGHVVLLLHRRSIAN